MSDQNPTNPYNNGLASVLQDEGIYDRKISNVYDELPEELQKAIVSVDSNSAINEVGKKFRLHMDQLAELGKQTGLVLLGITDPTDFIGIISSKLNIDRNTAAQIVGEINTKIFVPVKDSLRKLHGAPVKPAETPKTASANVLKGVETGTLNVPKQTIDILKGTAPQAPKKTDTSVLGFQAEKDSRFMIQDSGRKQQNMDSGSGPGMTPGKEGTGILEQKMGGMSLPKAETDLSRKPTGGAVDPYREAA